MTGIARLDLMSLEGNVKSFLEVELLESGDLCVEMRGQNINKEIHHILAQIPNPINGGGNIEEYKILMEVYNTIKKYNDKK